MNSIILSIFRYISNDILKIIIIIYLEKLHKKVLEIFIILEYYKNYLRKMDLYRQGIEYATEEWQTLSSHQKPLMIDEIIEVIRRVQVT